MTRQPRYSVVIPSRNRAALLQHAIDSVVRQGYDDYELVVSDNASAEDYTEIVAQFGDAPIRLSRSDIALSVTESWNRGIDLARGDYVVMLGDDDALAPGYFVAADRIIEQFNGPEVVYSPAYHYAWPSVVPGHPQGYLASVLNSELFQAAAPYQLDPEQSKAMAQRALRFRHHISFNAQHFLYSRGFLETLRQYGPVYQSPYPDFYACFATFLRAEVMVVDPVPRTIIGISGQSFGYFYLNNQEEEGALAFLTQPLEGFDLTAGIPGAAAALALPGSRHIRHWLCAALTAYQRFGGEANLFVDLPRYRRLQVFELAISAGHHHQITAAEFRNSLGGLTDTERHRAVRLYEMFRTLARNREVVPSTLASGMRRLLHVHGPAEVSYLAIGPHQGIADAIAWLEGHRDAAAIGDAQPTRPTPLRQLEVSEDPPRDSDGFRAAIVAKDDHIRGLETHIDGVKAVSVAKDERIKGLRERTVHAVSTLGDGAKLFRRIVKRLLAYARTLVRGSRSLVRDGGIPPEFRRAAGRIRRMVVRYPLLRAAVRVPWRLALRLSPGLRSVVANAVSAHATSASTFSATLAPDRPTSANAVAAAVLTRLHREGNVAIGRFVPFIPLNLLLDQARGSAAELQILLPSLRREHATGGPNTAYLLGCALAAQGIAVRFLATDAPLDASPLPMLEHFRSLTGHDITELPIRFSDASDRTKPVGLGRNDVFLATAWWTAQMAHAAAPMLGNRRIHYLIQDFEPLFYGASENWAQALETYSFDHHPIINTSLLRDELAANNIGLFSDSAFAASALTFEPAVDRALFHPNPRLISGTRTLLFYARPTIGVRNLFGMGVAALSAAIDAGLFVPEEWEFLGMGEAFEPVPLGRGAMLMPAPWQGLEGYAAQMRQADILLSPMLSPHPSYPPLEMAACGNPAVTTIYGVKTAERLAALSPAIIGVEPSVGALVWGLQRALRQADAASQSSPSQALTLPGSWSESLAPIIGPLVAQLARDGLRPGNVAQDLPLSPALPSAKVEPAIPEERYYKERRTAARRLYRAAETPRLLSIISTVYDTDVSYLNALAHSLFAQDGDTNFEWVLLDNGSTTEATREALARIAQDPRVRFGRAEQNLGIIGGMRWCLERASHRYVVPVDSDDLLAPHALRALGSTLEQHGLPPLLYSDEDKTDGTQRGHLYRKSDWDPVLFQHSCYIAHLTALDRELALELGCYTDPAPEGSHDWDSFTRFVIAGHTPVHLRDAIYTWRIHSASTSTDFRSKPYVFASQKAVLQRFLDARGLGHRYTVEPSGMFDGTPDWRFAPRTEPAAGSIPTITLGDTVYREALGAMVEGLPPGPLVHLHNPTTEIVRKDWAREATALMELFPDTAIVGGRLHRDGRVVESGYVFGAAGMLGAPERGQEITWPGEGATSWKPRSVGAVSARHLVVRRDLLQRAVQRLPAELALTRLGPWLGAIAQAEGSRVVYTPFFEGLYPSGAMSPPTEDATLAGRYGALSRQGTGTAAALPQPDAALALSPDYIRPSYAAWHEDRLLLRQDLLADHLGPTLSILTTVYSGTDTAMFRATAAAVVAQTSKPHEWLVLAHGPVDATLDAALIEFEAAGVLRRLVQPENLGIAGGLAHCLAHATGAVVLPLDADDLLTTDAVALIRAGFAQHPGTRLLYTDEDLLIEGEVRHPWHRPDADPVLLQAHSCIWHSIAFDRERGVELGAYQDKGAEYALDWDTLLRFHRAGDRALHVPEVTYHWRQHARSLSNSGETFAGSAQSVRHLLQGVADSTGHPERYHVSAAQFRTATPELMLHRNRVDSPTIAILSLGHRGGRPVCQDPDNAFVFAEQLNLAEGRGADGLRALANALEGVSATQVLLLGPGVALADWRGLWQAIQQLELVPEAIAVGGPLIDAGSILRTGSIVDLPDGGLADPLRGRRYDDPAIFSLAHKPHCVTVISPDLLLARTDALRAAIKLMSEDVALRSFGAALGASARRGGHRLVYEPLFVGALLDEDSQIGDPVEGLSDYWRASTRNATLPPRIEGLAGFVWQGLHHA